MSIYNVERNDSYDEMLDEVFPPYRMGIFEFQASDILYHLDPIAYRVGVSDWESEEDEDDETL